VDITAAAAADELVWLGPTAGLDVLAASRRSVAEAHSGDVLVLFLPATFDMAPLLRDLLDDLDRTATRGRTMRLVVTWCVRERDRPRMSAPHRADAGYDEGVPPSGWNASSLFMADAWPRAIRRTGGDQGMAALDRDRALRALFTADSHGLIGGQDIAEVVRLFDRLDPAHLHAAIVEVDAPARWFDVRSVVAAIVTRQEASRLATGAD
jgi:hypothetical protein